MDQLTAFELIKTLGSIASIVSAYNTFRSRGWKVFSKKEAEEILSAEYSEEPLLTRDEIKFVQSLPRDIGNAANERIRRALERYKKAWGSPMNVLELEEESEKAAWEICAVLRLIKKHNGGELPTKKLRDLWKTFNCEEKVH